LLNTGKGLLMGSHLIACVELDLGQLDAVMQYLSPMRLKALHWIVTTSDMNKLGAFHDLWANETTVHACLMPAWSADVEECIHLIVENERQPDETVLVLHGPACELDGALGRYQALLLTIDDRPGVHARESADRIAAPLDAR
jgi:hypothetical protein